MQYQRPRFGGVFAFLAAESIFNKTPRAIMLKRPPLRMLLPYVCAQLYWLDWGGVGLLGENGSPELEPHWNARR